MSIAEKLTIASENVAKVYKAGQQAEYNRFWDNLQDYGNETYYYTTFGGKTWTAEIFNPKYDMYCTTAYMLFYLSEMNVDLVEHLRGKILDLSRATSCKHAFSSTQFTRIGVVDLTSCKGTNAENLFANSDKLVTIDELVCPPEGTATTKWFDNCNSLENIKFSGVLKSNNMNLQWSKKLSKESILSLINVLSDETDGSTVTLSKEAVDNAFYDGTNIGSDSIVWLSLIESKQNWTISLI